jgi:adenylate kinase family enzyme|tara:strand:+ start:14071 stop:14667 length:597 start_codon:yes stop_codon:yes gene_type:complete
MIIHIVGNIGSGKTTLGHKLKKMYEDKIILIDTDKIKKEIIQKHYKSISKIQKACQTCEWINIYFTELTKILKKNNDKIIILTGVSHLKIPSYKKKLAQMIDYKFGIEEDLNKSYKKYVKRELLNIKKQLTTKTIDKIIQQKSENITIYSIYKYDMTYPYDFSFYVKLNSMFKSQNLKYGYKYLKSNLLLDKINEIIN